MIWSQGDYVGEQPNVASEITGIPICLESWLCFLVYQRSPLWESQFYWVESLSMGFTLYPWHLEQGLAQSWYSNIFEWIMELIRLCQDAVNSVGSTHLDGKPTERALYQQSPVYGITHDFPQSIWIGISPESRNPLLESMKDMLGEWKV